MLSWPTNNFLAVFSRLTDTIQLRILGHEFGLFSALFVVFVVSRIMNIRKGRRAVNYMTGMVLPFQPMNIPGALLPTTWWNPGLNFMWHWRFHFYQKYGSEQVAFVPFLSGKSSIYTSNLDVVRQVAPGRQKTSFEKPPDSTRAFLLWGMNILSAEGELWRKHRRIVGPAFNNDLYQDVWTETVNTYHQMIATEDWAGKDSIDVSAAQKFTFKLALLIIGKCGFGFSFDWDSPPSTADGSVSVQEALRLVTDNFMLLSVLPKFIQYLPFKRIRQACRAFNHLLGFMKTQVAERREEIRGQTGSLDRKDIFTMLVKANEDETAKTRLDDDELIGNVFVMLFAGHETTALTLAATIGFLGYHNDVQEETYEQIISVVGYSGDPTFEAYTKLDKVLGAFYEALRFFPPAFAMIREAWEDTVIQIPNPLGQEGSTPFPIAKGVQVIVDIIGVQNNPRYFPEPEKYKPSRWYGLSNDSEAVSAFSVGARACIGKKFATIEAVAFLTLLLRDWKIEPLLRGGETKEMWRDRVLDGDIMFTLGVKEIPVRLTRRKN